MRLVSCTIILFLCFCLINSQNATNSTGNATNVTNQTNTTNTTVQPYTYCSSYCIDYVQVCEDIYYQNCLVCSSSLFEEVPNSDGSCSTLDQHQLMYFQLQMGNLNLNQYQTSSNVAVTCDKYSFSGGYVSGGYISKTFNNLPSNHYQIVIRVNVGYIGYWDSTQSIYINIDDEVTTFNASCEHYEDLCSGSGSDCIRVRQAIVQHNATSVTINITSSMNQTDPSIQYWGIHDLLVAVRTCHSRCLTCFGPEASSCLTCQSGFYLQGNKCVEKCSGLSISDKKQCTQVCPQGYYTDNKICQNCVSGCALCFTGDTCSVWNDGRVGNTVWDQYLLLWILIILIGTLLIIIVIYKCLSNKSKVADNNIEQSMIPENRQNRENESREMVEIQSISVDNENNSDYFWVKDNTVKVKKKRKSRKQESPRIHEVEITNQDLNQ